MTRSLVLLILIAACLSFFMLGSVTLFDVDEAVFAQATKEMVMSGDWITPTYNGENRYDKPILFYWLMAVSYRLFGINEFGARLPSALSAFLLVLSIFFFMRRLASDRSALHASLAFVLSLYFLVYSHAAVTDMVLTLFISLSLFFFHLSTTGETGRNCGDEGGLSPGSVDREADAARCEKRNTALRPLPGESKRYLYCFYAFSALAFLTKGLIGILFPFAIASLYAIMTEGFKGTRRIVSGGGIVLFLIISLPWFVAQTAVNGHEFIDQFFVKHHFKRYTGVISGHRGPIYYYLPALILGMFPWIVFVPVGIRHALKERDRLLLFALIWSGFITLFFSFSTTKLPNYILPAIPAFSILAASGMASQGRWRSLAYISIALVAALMAAGFLVVTRHLPQYGVHDLNWTFAASGAAALMAGLSIFSALKNRSLYGILGGLMVSLLIILAVKALPLANGHLQGALHRYSLYARENLPPGEGLITYGINNPSIAFYSDHRVIMAGNREELLRLADGRKASLAIAKRKDSSALVELDFQVLDEDRGYVLLRRK